jgi:SAM-dependent methyltransferase
MWSDVVDLRDFYATSLGQVAARAVRARLRHMWPDTRGSRMLGLGYAPPCLRPFLDEAERVIAAMPMGQGVLHWPRGGPNHSVLVDELDLPFPDNAFDRIVLVHAVENAESLRQMLREVWRVLTDSGRMIVVVPNRRGIWARIERTPFAHGHPYSATQLSRLLRDNLFTPTATDGALFVPPSRSRMVLGASPAWENIGHRLLPRFAGVVIMEATKQIYAVSAATARERRRRPAYVPARSINRMPGS